MRGVEWRLPRPAVRGRWLVASSRGGSQPQGSRDVKLSATRKQCSLTFQPSNLGLSLTHAVIPICSSSSPPVDDLHDPICQGCGHLTRQSAQCTMYMPAVLGACVPDN
ncbi:unnamed protein product [Urochloa humidicola]